MNRIRKLLRESPVLKLLSLTFLLRSLIAPGFMLDTDSESPIGLTMTLCNGLNGINAIDGLDAVHDGHGNGDPVSHEEGHGLFSTHCAIGSAGGTLAADAGHATLHLLLLTTAERYFPETTRPHKQVSYYQRQQPRAPPVSYIG